MVSYIIKSAEHPQTLVYIGVGVEKIILSFLFGIFFDFIFDYAFSAQPFFSFLSLLYNIHKTL